MRLKHLIRQPSAANFFIVARARSGSDTPPAYHSWPSRRYATHRGRLFCSYEIHLLVLTTTDLIKDNKREEQAPPLPRMMVFRIQLYLLVRKTLKKSLMGSVKTNKRAVGEGLAPPVFYSLINKHSNRGYTRFAFL